MFFLELDSFREDFSILKNRRLVIANKAHDLRDLVRKHLKAVGTSITGTIKPNKGFAEMIPVETGSFCVFPEFYLASKKYSLSLDDMLSQDISDGALEPRDFIIDKDGSWILIADKKIIRIRDQELKNLELIFEWKGFLEPHSIIWGKNKDLVVITNSGNGRIDQVDLKKGEVKLIWSAYKEGYCISCGTSTIVGEKSIKNLYQKQFLEGWTFIEVDSNKVPTGRSCTGEQTTHINGCVWHPTQKDTLIAVLWSTRELDENGNVRRGKGSGGKIVAINVKSGKTRELITDLSNPHNFIPYKNDIWILANTSAGEILFYKENRNLEFKLVGVINLKQLSGNKRNGLEWTQSISVAENGELVIVDSARTKIYVVDTEKQTMASVDTGDDASTQSAWLI